MRVPTIEEASVSDIARFYLYKGRMCKIQNVNFLFSQIKSDKLYYKPVIKIF